MCSRHFPSGDSSQLPSLHLGKKVFFSPKKKNSPRAQRASKRKNLFFFSPVVRAKKHMSASAMTSSTEEDTAADVLVSPPARGKTTDVLPTLPVLSAPIGEPYFSDYSVYELPDSGDQSSLSYSVSS